MLDPKVLASTNLHAILRNLEDLSLLDSNARRLLSERDLSIRFSVPALDPLTLTFSNGLCTSTRADSKRRR